MRDFTPAYSLPNVPAVYAFYSGGKGPKYVAYVGIAGRLKQRIIQHLIRRDSSVTTGTSAVNLNPDQVTSLRWWEHPDFAKTINLKAAEMVAFEVLNPALRSRGATDNAGLQLLANNAFKSSMKTLFKEQPTGTVEFLSLADALDSINRLEMRIVELEKKIDELQK